MMSHEATMSKDENKYNKMIKIQHNEQDREDDSDTGSQGGQIEFRDFIALERQRDDQLSPEETKRLLATLIESHEQGIKKQKETLSEREKLKQGKMTLQEYRQSKSSDQIPHPLLADKAYFSGVDNKVKSLPTEYDGKTNEKEYDEQKHEYDLKYEKMKGKKFNQRPGYGK